MHTLCEEEGMDLKHSWTCMALPHVALGGPAAML